MFDGHQTWLMSASANKYCLAHQDQAWAGQHQRAMFWWIPFGGDWKWPSGSVLPQQGKCAPWEFPLFSGWPRMPSVRMAELEGRRCWSWWFDSKLDIFPLSILSPAACICSPSSPHTALCLLYMITQILAWLKYTQRNVHLNVMIYHSSSVGLWTNYRNFFNHSLRIWNVKFSPNHPKTKPKI